MGMSIDKTIDFFNGLKCYTPQAKDARDVAISTMRKYQKIEEIYKNEYKNYKIGDREFSKEVRKVLEDGNNAGND